MVEQCPEKLTPCLFQASTKVVIKKRVEESWESTTYS